MEIKNYRVSVYGGYLVDEKTREMLQDKYFDALFSNNENIDTIRLIARGRFIGSYEPYDLSIDQTYYTSSDPYSNFQIELSNFYIYFRSDDARKDFMDKIRDLDPIMKKYSACAINVTIDMKKDNAKFLMNKMLKHLNMYLEPSDIEIIRKMTQMDSQTKENKFASTFNTDLSFFKPGDRRQDECAINHQNNIR